MRKAIMVCLAALLSTGGTAQEAQTYKEKQSYKSWVRLAPKLKDDFMNTPEASRIADNVLLYQHTTGGWPKNVFIPAELSRKERKDVLKAKGDVNASTIDNGATTTEIRYLSRVYRANPDIRYRNAALNGIRYVLRSQYPNGGFPQFYPRPTGYYTHITYNDNAMVNVLCVLREISEGKAPYGYVPKTLRDSCRASFDLGIECILNTQVRQGDSLTVWCAQHDEHTLQPAKARAYELPSLSGAESDNIVLLLLSLPNPSDRVIAAVEGAVRWFEGNKITGIYAHRFINADGKEDYVMNPCPQDDFDCPALWARFYTLDGNRPFFCDRDGVPRYNLSEIGYERRNGYSWYNDEGNKVIRDYKKWRKRLMTKRTIGQGPTAGRVNDYPKDTSFTAYRTLQKVKKHHPYVELVKPQLPEGVVAYEDVIYSAIPQTRYGKRELRLNLYRKDDGKKYPALLMVHGGGWNSGDRTLQVPMAQQIAAQGYVTIPVEYRLRPEAIYPAALHDLKTAVRWVRAHADTYGIDTTRIAISGCSAGGHLASLLGMTNGSKRHEGDREYAEHSSTVQAVVNMDGCLTFVSPRNIAEAVEKQRKMKDRLPMTPDWLGGSYSDAQEQWEEASPLLWADKKAAPICFINSLLPRYRDGRDELIEQLDKLGILHETYQIEANLHPFWFFHPWFNSVVKYTVDFLAKAMPLK